MIPEAIYTVATLSGAAVGAAAEAHAVHKATQSTEALYNPTLKAAIEADANEAQSNEAQRASRISRATRLMSKGILPSMVAVFAGIEAYSFAPQPKPTSLKNALEVDVDDSAGVPINEIQRIVVGFNTANPQLQVGNVGNIHTMRAQSFKEFSKSFDGVPAGEAPLNQEINISLNDLAENGPTSKDDKTSLVVITDGDSLGNIQPLVQEATAQSTAISVVNLEKKGTNPKLLEQFKKLSKETDGTFYSANNKNVKAVAKAVNTETAPQAEQLPPNDVWPYRISGLLALFGAAGFYSNRRRFITTRNSKG